MCAKAARAFFLSFRSRGAKRKEESARGSEEAEEVKEENGETWVNALAPHPALKIVNDY